MAVAVDATGTALVGGSSVSTVNYTGITVGAALSNGALLVTLAVDSSAASPSATWDSGGTNQAMTLIGSKTTPSLAGAVMLFGLRNPTSGNKTLTLSWTGAGFPVVCAISFTGVNQTSIAAAFPGVVSSNGAANFAPSLTVTSAVGNIPVALAGWSATTGGSLGGTQIYTDSTSSGLDTEAYRNAGAATVNFTTVTGTGEGAAIACDVAAAAVGATLPFSLQDWPRVSPIRVSKPDGSLALNPNQYTNPIPINNSSSLFIPVQPVRLAKVDQFHTDISKFTNPIPLNVQELNRPWAIRGYPTPPQPYNPNLFTQVIVAAPFSQLQWSAARGLYALNSTPRDITRNPLIYSEVPFVNNAFAKVSPVASAPFIGQVYNVNLYSQTVSPAPFVTVDYSKAYPIRGVSQQVPSRNLNLYQTVSASVTARLGFHPIEAGSVKQTNIASGLQNLEDGTAG